MAGCFPEKPRWCLIEQVCQGSKVESALNGPEDWILCYLSTWLFLTQVKILSCSVKSWAMFCTLHCSSSLSCINEYLATDSGEYFYEHPSRINCLLWNKIPIIIRAGLALLTNRNIWVWFISFKIYTLGVGLKKIISGFILCSQEPLWSWSCLPFANCDLLASLYKMAVSLTSRVTMETQLTNGVSRCVCGTSRSFLTRVSLLSVVDGVLYLLVIVLKCSSCCSV